MRLITSILLIAIFAAIAEYFLPWWSVAIVAFIVAIVMKLKPGQAFLAGFLAIAFLWIGVTLWWDIPNQHLLSGRLAQVFKLPNHVLFIIVVGIVGGLVGGMSAWSGALLGGQSKKRQGIPIATATEKS